MNEPFRKLKLGFVAMNNPNLKLRLGFLWQIYDVADSDEETRQMFVARYGREPRLIWRDGGCVHAGPITKEEHDGKT